MVVHFKFSALKQGRPYEYIVRFALGGLATVVAGLVANWAGPEAGGVMLAFPAIFCASATLIEKHERVRKEKHGLRGERRGRAAAALDAAGAGWGSLGLACFALFIWQGRVLQAALCLAAGSLVWFTVAVLMWRLRRELRFGSPS
ncbi:hypothetical protein WN73_18290 [Bradyrhizobium sp. CCBAU 45394]|uniref:DUF3147 family protein n=1 Tax=Bradyrhizobium TaxID=374 RepID=UPI0023030415|nr:DUF3147 family protein [Bradyrhizobium sp. CCBAU 45394]MDA9392491.1 hypothetical protein [Bradyrhizobium sp. CCBAU 45394]